MDWIIGGTKDSRNFIEKILKFRSKFIVTIVSEYGGKLLENYGVNVEIKSMKEKEMKEFIKKNNIERIFDFSHPYALEVSRNAINASKETKIGYYRFDRSSYGYEKCQKFQDLDNLIKYIENLKGNILCALGSNKIKKFESLKNLKNIYFRVLPTKAAIENIENIGVLAKNIIGIQGPFSKEFNSFIYKQYNINYLLTKESGDIGGEQEKIDSALENNIEIIILKKPLLNYPWKTNNFEIILEEFYKMRR